ncbi:hypothetical protein BC827DRAFT_1153795 [Russula dissimulans]|nr:hypothetical protein BC827DRAFT_1153795 [Russula dissimulans]
MSDHPSPELRSLFEAALNEFETRTGTKLVQNRIFDELLACESVESILYILQEQAKPLRTALGNDSTLMKWIKRTVTVLHFLSTNKMIVDGVSSAFPPARAVFAAIGMLLSAINVKDIDKNYDTLIDLFESFESVLKRLDIYTKIPSTPAMTEIIVKILTELLYTISLAIQQIRQGRFKRIGKKLLGQNDHEVEAILRRLDRLTLEEARMTGTTTLQVVYDILKNMTMVMDDRSVLMDDIRRILGVAVDMQQIAINMNKSKRVFNPDSRL